MPLILSSLAALTVSAAKQSLHEYSPSDIESNPEMFEFWLLGSGGNFRVSTKRAVSNGTGLSSFRDAAECRMKRHNYSRSLCTDIQAAPSGVNIPLALLE